MGDSVPTFSKLALRDHIIKNALWMIVAPWIIHFGTYFMDGIGIPFMPYVAGVLSLIGIVTIAVRYRTITSTFRDGQTVTGKISNTEVYVSRNRKSRSRTKSYYVVCEYSVNGQNLQRKIRTPGRPDFYGLSQGQNVQLAVHANDPQTVFIKSIYLD